MRLPGVFLLTSLVLARLTAADDYLQSVEAWRAHRLERLTRSDGWLSLIGLHWLQTGDNLIGRAPDNSIVLAAGPAHFGTINLAADGTAVFTPAPDSGATANDQPAAKTALDYRDEDKPTIVRSSTVSFYVIKRGDRIGLRVKDSASPRRTGFRGLDYFAVDPAWRIEARWEPFDHPREMQTTNVLGQAETVVVPGRAVFMHDGREVALLPVDEAPGERLFIVISDQTSGRETYEAGRFIYADRPKDGKIVIDFNEAYNPPCAFSPFATCPLPLKENRLPFPVRAGEKKYHADLP